MAKCKALTGSAVKGLRPSGVMPLPSENLSGASGHQRLKFDCFIYIRFAAPLYTAGTERLRRESKKPMSYFSAFFTFVEQSRDNIRIVFNALPVLSISCLVPKIFAVKVVVKLRSRQQRQSR